MSGALKTHTYKDLKSICSDQGAGSDLVFNKYQSWNIQCSPIIMLFWMSIGMDPVISESCYKGTTYLKIWSFSYLSFEKLEG